MSAKTIKKKKPKYYMEEPREKGDFEALVEHIKENPWQYGLGAAFVVFCGIAGLLYMASASETLREQAETYMTALQAQDRTEQLDALEDLQKKGGPLEGEAAYMIAEKAYREDELDKAREHYEKVRTEFPDSRFAPAATEGLAFLHEQEEELEEAEALYEEIQRRWPDSFVAVRQPLNLGRVAQKLGRVEEALTYYRDQVALFPESNAARRAQARVNRLEKEHPEFAQAPLDDAEAPETPVEPVQPGPAVSEPDTDPPVEPGVEPAPDEGLKLELPANRQPDEGPSREELPELEQPTGERLRLPSEGAAQTESQP